MYEGESYRMNERIKGEILMQPNYKLKEEEVQELVRLTTQMLFIKEKNHVVPVPDGFLEKMLEKFSEKSINLAQINLAFEFMHSCIDCTRSFAKTEHYEDCYSFSLYALDYLNILNTVYLRGSQENV